MIIEISESSSRKEPSDSSPSTTRRSEVLFHRAPQPISFKSPPIRKEGSVAAADKSTDKIEDVVVLPCVPATTIDFFLTVIAAIICARVSTGTPASKAAATSGFPSGMAVDLVRIFGFSKFDVECPIVTFIPLLFN